MSIILTQEKSRVEAGPQEGPDAFVTFLASWQANYITGATIQIDGGSLRALW